jgi:hypothetical protein
MPHAGEIAAHVGVASDPTNTPLPCAPAGSDAEVARQALDPARAALEKIRDTQSQRSPLARAWIRSVDEA